MSLTKAVLTSPDENPFGKPVYVRGVLYLDDVPEDDSANDAGDSSVDKPGDADNEEPENGGGNNDADLPPERLSSIRLLLTASMMATVQIIFRLVLVPTYMTELGQT